MGPFDSIKHKIEHSLSSLGDSIKDQINKTGKDLDSKLYQHYRWQVGQLTSKFNGFKSDIDKVAASAESTLKHAASDAEHGISTAADAANSRLEDTAHHLQSQADEALKQMEDAKANMKELAKEEFNEMVENAIRALSAVQINRVLNILKAVGRAACPASIGINLGPVDCTWTGFEDRVEGIVEQLTKWADNAPANKADILQFIEDVAPTEVGLSASIGLGFVVQSSDAEIGIGLTWETATFVDNVDFLLEQFGL